VGGTAALAAGDGVGETGSARASSGGPGSTGNIRRQEQSPSLARDEVRGRLVLHHDGYGFVVPDVPMPQDPMALPSGYYVMVPQEHQDELNSELPKLTVQNGFLVHTDAPQTDDLQTRAKNAVPGVSYATLRMYCDKAPANGCSNPPTTTGTA